MRTIEVDLDDRWLLPVPSGGDPVIWANEKVATLQSEPDRDPAETVDALVALTASADPTAFATLLFCPDGLPGRALVAVYAAESDLSSLDDLPELAPAALPRQVLPLREHDPTVGRIISTITQVPDVGILGTLHYELLRDGALLEVVVTSPSLPHLGAGMPVFEELIERIIVAPSGSGEHVTA
ncbi:hypothetical protein [Microbacterium saperdae]|uniref:Uncharacterized protein n=1 Tax=Microbacterium saperdae TaxID=69368 RepID=A0A543BC42_9MICO|nr:hypothetical protein [Microbacterium saperdae]TQL82378.1 hypothetical protein FB560_3862 [Microbacterium saperdae]GGM39354.1 hypothetical protein GCM10010489_07980 [Microbacterium saperdae]